MRERGTGRREKEDRGTEEGGDEEWEEETRCQSKNRIQERCRLNMEQTIRLCFFKWHRGQGMKFID